MFSANRNDFVPPSDCNSVNEVFNAPSWFAPRKLRKGIEIGYTTLANSDSSLKPFNCLIIGHARAGAHAIDGFNYICQFPPNGIVDISKWIEDIFKSFGDIYNSFGDIYKYCLFADISNWIGDISNSFEDIFK